MSTRILSQITLAAAVLAFAQEAWPAPVMNLNAPGAENVTIYPDHLDKSLYYIAPTRMLLNRDEAGVPVFRFMEEAHFLSKKAVIQSELVPSFSQKDIELAQTRIRALNASARFAALPFLDSQVVFGDAL